MTPTPFTADLCDANEDRLADGGLQVLAPGFLALGQRQAFFGQAQTLRLFEDNAALAELLQSPGEGRVLVVDGGGSRRCALFGGNLAAAATKNGWAGLIIHGSVRDAHEIEACDIGVRALALNPRRAGKRGGGEVGATVALAGVRVSAGDWIYADRDGVLVSRAALHRG
ncbi:MAG: ribonuclease E activity regulator RraA [Burkholderiaceae bacterium]